MKDHNWLIVQRAAARIADRYGGDRDDLIHAGMASVIECAKAGGVGSDLAWALRKGIQSLRTQGWMEEEEPEYNLMDAVHAAFEHYADGSIMLEEQAIQQMMELEEDGDHEGAQEIQQMLWQWEMGWWSEPEPDTVFEPVKDNSLQESIKRAYKGGEPIATPFKIKGRRVGTTFTPRWQVAWNANRQNYNYPEPELTEQYAVSTTVLMEGNEHEPVYLQPDKDEGAVESVMNRIGNKGLLFLANTLTVNRPRFNKAVRKIAYITEFLTNEEKVMVASRIGFRVSRILGYPPLQESIVKMFVGVMDIDIEDDQVAFLLEDIDWSENIPITGTDEDVQRFIALISLMPEHPKWKPWHDRAWIEGSEVLTTRNNFQTCKASGKAAYFQGNWRSKQARHNAGKLRVTQLREKSLVANGRSWRLEELADNGYVASTLELGDRKESFMKALLSIGSEPARRLAEVLA